MACKTNEKNWPLLFTSLGCPMVTLRSETLLYMSTPQPDTPFKSTKGYQNRNQHALTFKNKFLGGTSDATTSFSLILSVV